MFQLNTVHNEFTGLELGEFLEIIASHGLTVVHQEFDIEEDETYLTLQGTKEGFISWAEEGQEGGPSFNEEEFMEELTPV